MRLTGAVLRIGELADLAGVTPRTIRHYHQVGLLPEPARTAAGYRAYGLGHAGRLIQICRLTALGLGLSGVAAVLGAPDGAAREADMREILTDLDMKLAAQERELATRRSAVRRVLEDGVDPTLGAAFADAHRLTAVEADMRRVTDVLRDGSAAEPLPANGGARDNPDRRRWLDLDVLFTSAADLAPDDPHVAQIAEQMVPMLLESLPRRTPDEPDDAQLLLGRLVLADLTPAQHRIVQLLLEHGSGSNAARKPRR